MTSQAPELQQGDIKLENEMWSTGVDPFLQYERKFDSLLLQTSALSQNFLPSQTEESRQQSGSFSRNLSELQSWSRTN